MNIGKVYKYDGIIGEIVTSDGKKYVFTYNGLEEEVKKGDIVNFKIRYKDDDIVTDIKKYNNKDLKTLLREYKENNNS